MLLIEFPFYLPALILGSSYGTFWGIVKITLQKLIHTYYVLRLGRPFDFI